MISNKHYQKGQGSEKSLILFFLILYVLSDIVQKSNIIIT